jgi:GntR family transcriptional repressor for pyruvate dehydrogenase complex
VSVEFDQILIEPAYRKVAVAIADRILDRSLLEGARLPPEMELARQFGVNRSTVREALRELESSGLVTRRPGSRRMSVSRPGHLNIAEGISRALVLHDVTFLEVWEALTVIEPPIAEAAARARTPADLQAAAAAAEAFAADAASGARLTTRCSSWLRSLFYSCSRPRCRE